MTEDLNSAFATKITRHVSKLVVKDIGKTQKVVVVGHRAWKAGGCVY